MIISRSIFRAYLKCPTKCWLLATGAPPTGNAHAEWMETQSESYRAAATERLLSKFEDEHKVISPCQKTLRATKWQLAVDVEVISLPTLRQTSTSCDLATNLHALERASPKDQGKAAQFVPTLFVFNNHIGKDDKLALAFDAIALSDFIECEIVAGKIIHGDEQDTLKVKTSALTNEVRVGITNIAALLSSPTPPDIVLNRHCSECIFQARCRKTALESDDLSLLSNMSEKERKMLRNKGIFTVTQLSYTFRPRRRPKKLREKREKHRHSLRALAIREKKIHIVGRPELKIEGTPVFLDVEGLPDRDFYYLIGARIGRGQSAVQYSFWADTIAEEGSIWRDLLGILATVEKPILVHYGSYETKFLNRMRSRYGLPSQVLATVRDATERTLNLLSFMFATVYFPTYGNSLKEIARLLGFKWSDEDASGAMSVIWRQKWEQSHSRSFKQKLVTYNAEDCEAVARLEKHLTELSSNAEGGNSSGLKDVVHEDSMPRERLNTFKKNAFLFAEFEQNE